MKRFTKFALALIIFCLISSPVFAVETHRISGENRYETAANIAKEGWSSAEWAIIAFGGNFPDALASTPLAVKYNAPILLTDKNSLTSVTKNTLTSLGIQNVFIVGGTSAVSQNVENQIKAAGISVTRIAGSDRYNTSIKIAEQLNSDRVFVTNGSDYPNALSASSYAGSQGIPIILTGNALSADLKSYLSARSINETYVIGNEVSESIKNQLPSATRISGGNKYETNLAVLNYFDMNPETAFLATGNNFADALAGSAYAALTQSPIVLTDKVKNTQTADYLSSFERVNILGGESAVSTSLINSYLGQAAQTNLTAKAIFDQVSPSVVYIEVADQSGKVLGSGSGFVIGDGKVVTNYHVIDGAFFARLKTSQGQIYDISHVTAYDKANDLAIVKSSVSGLKSVVLGDSNSVETGDRIYAIGNPLGLENTMSDGLISTKSRNLDGTTYIQISAPISHGSSGGVLLDESGKVIGITTAGIDEGQNLNFAIPVNTLKPLLNTNINMTLAELSPPKASTPAQPSYSAFFPGLSTVPMPIGANYVRTGLTGTTAFYYYDWYDVSSTFLDDYDVLLAIFGWTYHKQNKQNDSVEVYYAKDGMLMGIGISPQYLVIYGTLH